MLHTTSEVISLAKKFENESAKFYEGLSRKYPEDKDVLLSFVEENGKNVVQIERAYYGVITDALEGCFAFNINPDDYTFKTELTGGMSYAAALDRAIEIEEKIAGFYTAAAEQSKSLMADVPRSFMMVVKKRGNRVARLRSL